MSFCLQFDDKLEYINPSHFGDLTIHFKHRWTAEGQKTRTVSIKLKNVSNLGETDFTFFDEILSLRSEMRDTYARSE